MPNNASGPQQEGGGGPSAGNPIESQPMGVPGASHLGTWETTDLSGPEAEREDQD